MSQSNTSELHEDNTARCPAYDKELELLLRLALHREKVRRQSVVDVGKPHRTDQTSRKSTASQFGNVIEFPGRYRNPISEEVGAPSALSSAAEPITETGQGNARFGLMQGPQNIFREEFT